MRRHLTRELLAELYLVAPVTIDLWSAQGMPGPVPGAPGAAEDASPMDWRVTRRDLARMWATHPDTLSRWAADGLGAARVNRGEKEALYDLRLATRWKEAYDGGLNRIVLEDFRACAQAGILALHALPATPALAAPPPLKPHTNGSTNGAGVPPPAPDEGTDSDGPTAPPRRPRKPR